MVNAVVGILW